MINCPKCGVPNPDNSTACVACGTALAGQQFAQALDQAQQQQPQQGQPQQQPPQQGQPQQGQPQQPMDPQAGAQQPFQQPMDPQAAGQPQQPMDPQAGVQPQQPAPGFDEGAQPGFGGPVGSVGQPMDPVAAQAEINQFLEEQKARKRTKTIIYLAILAAGIAVFGFLFLQNARKERRKREIYGFYTNFLKLKDEGISTFWKCTVRAKHRDVSMAKDTLEITDGLQKAFANFPKSQPDHIKDKCVPMVAGIVDDLSKLKAPEGFAEPIGNVIEAMKKTKDVFMAYANKIEQRKAEAIVEQEIRNMHNAFHMAADNPDSDKALEYWNLMKCAVPDLVKEMRAIKKPPNTQPVVEYIYKTCKEDPKYADKLRKECYEQRNASLDKDAEYKKAVYQMSGDNRDGFAIDDCFQRANRGFDQKEIEAVAKVFVDYSKAYNSILEQLSKVKQQLSD